MRGTPALLLREEHDLPPLSLRAQRGNLGVNLSSLTLNLQQSKFQPSFSPLWRVTFLSAATEK